MSIPLNALKVARLFSLHKLQEIKLGCKETDSLSPFPFLQPLALIVMKNKFPEYMVATEDVRSENSPFDFWKRHEITLPAWAEEVKWQLSSAAAEYMHMVKKLSAASCVAAECILSFLKCHFGE